MKVRVKGKPERVGIDRVKDAAHFYGEQLMSKRLRERLIVTIDFVTLAPPFVLGFCTWDDDNRRPKEFLIELDRTLSVRKTLRTLAHEMVHVKQYARGELFDPISKPGHVKWMGSLIPMHDDDKYWDLPWEIEAYGREVGLYHRFKSQKRSRPAPGESESSLED
jgi:hypothetical protein